MTSPVDPSASAADAGAGAAPAVAVRHRAGRQRRRRAGGRTGLVALMIVAACAAAAAVAVSLGATRGLIAAVTAALVMAGPAVVMCGARGIIAAGLALLAAGTVAVQMARVPAALQGRAQPLGAVLAQPPDPGAQVALHGITADSARAVTFRQILGAGDPTTPQEVRTACLVPLYGAGDPVDQPAGALVLGLQVERAIVPPPPEAACWGPDATGPAALVAQVVNEPAAQLAAQQVLTKARAQNLLPLTDSPLILQPVAAAPPPAGTGLLTAVALALAAMVAAVLAWLGIAHLLATQLPVEEPSVRAGG